MVGGLVVALAPARVAGLTLGGSCCAAAAGKYSIISHLITPAQAVGVAVVWSGVVALVAMLIVKAIFGGARVAESAESDGLDISSHGEHAYN